ncbi:choice-of-anchor tandem repeat GloVer-containing protein [Dyella dinghuensis]|nr:choice-of-anchor tandem repeat GloVer-containing protein [Dyella dinghuensis]
MALSSAAHAAAPHVSQTAMPGTSQGINGLAQPISLIVGNDGNVYGVAGVGGIPGRGGIFSVTPAGSYTDLYEMTANDGVPLNGSYPFSGNEYGPKLSQMSNGTLLFSSAFLGPPLVNENEAPEGTVSTLSSAGSLTNLFTFSVTPSDGGGLWSSSSGACPTGLFQGADGNFYGYTMCSAMMTTSQGTVSSPSVVFRVTPGGVETPIYVSTDALPPNTLQMDQNGEFYGSLPQGAISGSAGDILFEMNSGGDRTLLYTLDSADGNSITSLTKDAQGNLFGATSWGGAGGAGTIFEYSAAGQFSVLYSFSYANNDGSVYGEPTVVPSLIVGADGNLYGVTTIGGTANSGTVFRVSPKGVFTSLYSFTGQQANGGYWPNAVLQGSGRAFYGTTQLGGANGGGEVFRLTVPVADDLIGSGRSSVMSYGPGELSTLNSINNGSAVMQAIAQGYYPAAVGDFNGDGIADILWTSAKNDMYIWFGSASGYVPKYYGTVPSGSQIVGAGDMNNDGVDDIVFNNVSQHLLSYVLMGDPSAWPIYKTVSYTPGYYPIAIGDFNGDGYADIVWTSAKNDIYIWFAGANGFTSKYITTFPPGWLLEGRGDLDGNGTADLVWVNASGTEWGYWMMSNSGAVQQIVVEPIPPQLQGYHIATVADFNGDGRADILWTNGMNTMLMTNQGTACNPNSGCSFTLSTPSFVVPSGQVIFNSGLPSTVPIWAN